MVLDRKFVVQSGSQTWTGRGWSANFGLAKVYPSEESARAAVIGQPLEMQIVEIEMRRVAAGPKFRGFNVWRARS